MTKEEILAMTAGRKLDGLVGKEVMGLEVEYPYGAGYPYILVESKEGRKVWDAVFLYSTDISAAWLVVEKIQELFSPTYISIFREFGSWFCQLRKFQNSKETLIADSGIACGTAPEAICKAALLAHLAQKSVSV